MTTPLPAPPPPPPITVNVPPANVTTNLPADVVDKLAPHHSLGDWLYSQGATVFGVVVAIIAAGVAWCAVQRQITAESKRQKRTEKLDALSNAAGVVTEVWYWAFKNQDPTPMSSEDVIRTVADMQLKVVTAEAKFELLGMANERDALKAYWEKADQAKDVGKVTALGLQRKSLVDQLTQPLTD